MLQDCLFTYLYWRGRIIVQQPTMAVVACKRYVVTTVGLSDVHYNAPEAVIGIGVMRICRRKMQHLVDFVKRICSFIE